jgi:hypothetical protein
MIKIMRKNRKVLLAVFGALLMVMFLLSGPQSIFQPNPEKAVVATVGSRDIRALESLKTSSEFEAMKELSGELVQALQIENSAHWMLLTEEAQRAGLVGATGESSRQLLFEQLGQVMIQQALRSGQLNIQNAEEYQKLLAEAPVRLENEVRPRIAGQMRMSLDEFDRAVAKLQGILRLRSQYTSAVRLSEKRAVEEVQSLYDGVVIDGLVIPAEKLAKDMPEPTPEQVQAQFEKYKDVKPGTGEFGFGYVLPARVKFEYMVINRDALRNLVKLDPVKVSKHYLQNRAKYTGDEATETPRVEKDLTEAAVDQMMGEADRMYAARLKPDLRVLPIEGGKRKLPADWDSKGVRLSGTAEALATGFQELGHNYTPPVIIQNSTWTKVRDLSSVPGVGTATFRTGTDSGSLRELVEAMAELDPATTLQFQAKVPFELGLTDASGNRYFVNVLEWRPESPADSIEEVREDVVKDLKNKSAYDRLVSMQDDLRSQAITSGLDSIASLYPTPAAIGAADPTPKPLPVYKYSNLTRSMATAELNVKEVRDAVMAKAQTLGVKMVATAENLPDRTLTVPIPSTLSLAVVQILGGRPATQEVMRTLSRETLSRFTGEELREHNSKDPYSFEALSARYNYKAVGAEDDSKKKSS